MQKHCLSLDSMKLSKTEPSPTKWKHLFVDLSMFAISLQGQKAQVCDTRCDTVKSFLMGIPDVWLQGWVIICFMRDSVTNFGRFGHLFRQIFSLSFSLSLLVIVTILTKALIWGSWLLFMCRHPGCQGNQSKVVSKRQHRTLQCSRKTAAPACTQRVGTHSSTHHDTHSRIFSTLSVSLNSSRACAWEDLAVAEFVDINKSHGYQNEGKLSEQTRPTNSAFPVFSSINGRTLKGKYICTTIASMQEGSWCWWFAGCNGGTCRLS